MSAKRLPAYGSKGREVKLKVWPSTPHLVTARWHEHGRPRKKSWPNTTEGVATAKAWAKAFADARERPEGTRATTSVALTLADLWERYQLAEFSHLREKTKDNYRAIFHDLVLYLGRTFLAREVSHEVMDRYRAHRTQRGLSQAQTREYVKLLSRMLSFAVRRRLLGHNPLADYRYRIAKDDLPKPIPEYTPEEYAKIVAHFDPKKAMEWRRWAVIVLCGELGGRITATCRLRWEDVDFDALTVTWRAEFDKVGRERTQPLTTGAVAALLVAYGWSVHDGDTSGWVFYSRLAGPRAGAPMDLQGVWVGLRAAEEAAKVPHVPRRAFHSLRRMAATNALAVTGGNIADAMWWIGDTDLRQAKKYLRRRDGRLEAIAAGLDRLGAGDGAEQTDGREAGSDLGATVPGLSALPETRTAPERADAVSASTARVN